MDSINTDLIALEQQLGFEVYPKRGISLVRGKGALVWDIKGKQYIDCVAGIGVANVGHCNPDVIAAISHQAQTLITCPGIFYNDVRAQAVQKLVETSPSNLTKAFISNSGTEAMEAAIKFARITTGKNGFISAMRGFHGRTMGSLSATFKYRNEFEPLIPGHQFVPFNKMEKLQEAMNDSVAAVILELVQGEGGVRIADKTYLQSVQTLCRERGVLLIIDEIQTGFGRTGTMFACEQFGIQPDIMTLAKAMAGGLPMGATLCSDDIASAAGKHGSTFGGNPLVSAACCANIDYLLKHNLVSQAKQRGEYFVKQFSLKQSEVVREVRQIGLMIGIELKTKARPYIETLMEKGILVLPAGPTVIRLLPPLVISEQQLDELVYALHIVLDAT